MSKYIFDFLVSRIGNEIGAAAVMGNLYVESHLNPVTLEGKYGRMFGMTSKEYTEIFDRITSSEIDTFVRDGAGYGLAQWTYWSRKKGLWNYAQECEKSVGDLDVQLGYLWKEIQGYKKVMPILRNPPSLREASDIVAKEYEKPANTEEKYLQNRANYGQKFYDEYATKEAKNAMKSAVYVDEQIAKMKVDGTSIPDAIWETSKLCVGWPYVFGARGGKTTKDGITVRQFDCRGFTYWCALQFGISINGQGCTSQWNDENNWAEKGTIDNIPNDKLVCLFYKEKNDPKKMAHTGFGYRGETTECSSGVQYFTKRKAKWTYWAIPKGLYKGSEIISPQDTTVKLPTLRKGSKGEFVTVLQTLLMNRGYKLPKFGADGSFGDETVAAVKQFQKDWGLAEDGVVGPKTWDMLETSPEKQQMYTVTIPHVVKEVADELVAKYSGTMTMEKG